MADLFIGLMSGTSMDGIDAALVDLSSTRPTIIATHSHAYPVALHQRLDAALELDNPLNVDLTELDIHVGGAFAEATNALLSESGATPDAVVAIGSHGQTIRHEPEAVTPYSLQIGNAETLATQTGIDVIADFRRADIEAGGQGAPLAPAFHKAVFSSEAENRVALNIGGIANITTLPADTAIAVTGFDTGPGNTLMDYWVQQHLDTTMDIDGLWAAAGNVYNTLLTRMLTDPYFTLPPPKSSGREYFNENWLLKYTTSYPISAQSIQTTLCELTAQSIATAIRSHAADTQRVIVCGGGVHNRHLMARLKANLKDIPVDSSMTHGVDPDWVEAAAFAWLAKRRLDERPGNIPAVTGANQAVLLGDIVRH
ncbi:MAG: anhydro-N-acetylmuramic acid kinase [Pseudomonadota bacterium]